MGQRLLAALCCCILATREADSSKSFVPLFNGRASVGTFSDERSTGERPFNAKIKWAYFMDRGAAYSQPTLATQRGNGSLIIVSSLGADLHALDPQTGAVAWRFYGSPFSAAPAVMPNGNIAIGGQNYKLHVVSFRGNDVFSVLTDAAVMVKALVNQYNEIYIGNANGMMHKWSENGTELWRYDAKSRIEGGAALLRDGSIVFGTFDGRVLRLSKNGEEIWIRQVSETQQAISTTPAIGDTTILVGSRDFTIYALNMDGSPKWNYTTSGPVLNSPMAISQTEFVVTSQDTTVYRFRGDGSLMWQHMIGSWPTPPTVVGRTIIVGAWSKLLIGFTFWGEKKWQIELLGSIRGQPFVTPDEILVVGCTDGYVYAITIEGEDMTPPKVQLYDQTYFSDIPKTLAEKW